MSSALVPDWKQEPLSPIIDELTPVSEDVLLYWIDLEQPDLKLETENVANAQLKDIDSEMADNLDNLEDLDEWIKQEPFSNWLDEKMLPMSMFDMDPTILSPSKADIIKSDTPDTQSLLKEFETVLDYVNPGTLTPPQSPQYVQQPLLATLEPMSVQTLTYILPPKEEHSAYQTPEKLVSSIVLSPSSEPESFQADYGAPPTPPSNIAHVLAEVDELVRSRVEDMVPWNNPSSPSNSGSNFDDSSSSEDPEWVPEPVEELAFPTKNRRRFKPYSRVPPEDKKSRKKEQNKNAATRYRLKKKAEVEEILNEERSIMKENDELGNKVSDLQREIRYLKGLMRDLFRAKGLIN